MMPVSALLCFQQEMPHGLQGRCDRGEVDDDGVLHRLLPVDHDPLARMAEQQDVRLEYSPVDRHHAVLEYLHLIEGHSASPQQFKVVRQDEASGLLDDRLRQSDKLLFGSLRLAQCLYVFVVFHSYLIISISSS